MPEDTQRTANADGRTAARQGDGRTDVTVPRERRPPPAAVGDDDGCVTIDDVNRRSVAIPTEWPHRLGISLSGDGVDVALPGSSAVGSDDVRVRTGDQQSHEIASPNQWLFWILPTALGVLTVALSSLGPTIPSVVVGVCYALTLLTGVAGTVVLYDDARALGEADGDWSPNPWAYVVGGAVGVSVAFAVLSGTSGSLAAVFGTYVLGLAVASVVVGPVYFVRRLRHVGLLGSERSG
ncbi:hypothetical protein VB779_16070 [Haloarculaceae archaeon H-GB11]|nr:hypothetical protein [Haloarculaceae archaeon H-GB11]